MLCLLPAAGHDQMWLLYAAGLVLHGTRLYGPHLFESNPPLIVWLSMVPDWIAELLRMRATAVAKALVIVAEAGVWLLCRRLWSKLLPDRWPGLWWKLSFAYIAIFAVLPARDFGQRDQLLAVLCLPYLLTSAIDLDGRKLPAAFLAGIGCLAGVGFSLKPHHLLVPAAIEVALLWERISRLRRGQRLLRPEAIAIVITCALYYATIRTLTPEYVSKVLPVLRDTYWAIGHLSVLQSALASVQLTILATAALGLHLANRNSSVSAVTRIFLIAGFASLAAYYLQGTGWYYQQIPALSFFALSLWIEMLDWSSKWDLALPRYTPAAAASVSALALVLAAYFSGYRLNHPLAFPSGLSDVPDPTFFAGLPPGTPVAILTTEVDDSVPPVYLHRFVWAQRENNLWTLPAILRNESPSAPGDPGRHIPPDRLAALDRMQHRWMSEDFQYWRPRLVLIERCQDPAVSCQILEDRHDNLLAWFLRDPGFREIFSHYHYLRSSGPFDAYVPN